MATLSVTNGSGTTNGQTLVVNGGTRTWTNNVTSSPSTLVAITNSPAAATTNLLTHLGLYSAGSAISIFYGSSTSIVMRGNVGGALAVSAGGGWATVTLTTNVFTNTYIVRVPGEVEYASNRALIYSLAAKAISDYSTSAIATNAAALSNYLSRGPQSQVVAGATVFQSGVGGTNLGLTNGPIVGARLTNVFGVNGTVQRLTNGNYQGPILEDPVLTNGVNHGLAFSSPGTNSAWEGSEQFGLGGLALTNFATALNGTASGYAGTALGYGSEASGDFTLASGAAAVASGYGAIALGVNTLASGSNAIAIGGGVQANHASSIVISSMGQASSASNEVTIGSSSELVRMVGRFQPGTVTNGTYTGTNQWVGDVAYPLVTIATLANGNNLAVALTNVFTAVSGPTAAFTINGIYGGRNGRRLQLLNRSGQTMTIAHESGVDPTAENRIICSPANDQPFLDGEMVGLWYDGASARWRCSVHTTNSVTATNAVGTVSTNSVAMTTAATSLNFLDGGQVGVLGTNSSGAVTLQFFLKPEVRIGGLVVTNGVTNQALTASRAMVTDAAQKLSSSAVTATELGYMSGVTSALQTQLDNKVDESSGVATGLAVYTSVRLPGAGSFGSGHFLDGNGWTNNVPLRLSNLNGNSSLVSGAGGLVTESSRPLLDAFCAIDGAAYYPTNPWVHLVDEGFNGNQSSTTGSSIGKEGWVTSGTGTGTLDKRLSNAMTNAFEFLSLQSTGSTASWTYLLGGSAVPGGIQLTNWEFIMWARVAVNNTNTSGEIRQMRVGFCDSGTLQASEASNGAYVLMNTNLNTNTFVLVTASGGARTITYQDAHSANAFSPMTWVNAGLHLDSTGTNFTLIVGSNPTNFTAVATNSGNCPGSTYVGPFLNVANLTAVGNVLRTNYCDSFHVWGRPLSGNW